MSSDADQPPAASSTPPLSRDDLADRYLDQLQYDPYPVQEEALLAWFSAEQGVLVCAPTGMGKTLIAEAALFEALHTGQVAYYTTPLIALTEQKFREMQANVSLEQMLDDGDSVAAGTRAVRDAVVVGLAGATGLVAASERAVLVAGRGWPVRAGRCPHPGREGDCLEPQRAAAGGGALRVGGQPGGDADEPSGPSRVPVPHRLNPALRSYSDGGAAQASSTSTDTTGASARANAGATGGSVSGCRPL